MPPSLASFRTIYYKPDITSPHKAEQEETQREMHWLTLHQSSTNEKEVVPQKIDFTEVKRWSESNFLSAALLSQSLYEWLSFGDNV